jgi:hypothetical protein
LLHPFVCRRFLIPEASSSAEQSMVLPANDQLYGPDHRQDLHSVPEWRPWSAAAHLSLASLRKPEADRVYRLRAQQYILMASGPPQTIAIVLATLWERDTPRECTSRQAPHCKPLA